MKTKLCHGKEGILQKMNDRGSGEWQCTKIMKCTLKLPQLKQLLQVAHYRVGNIAKLQTYCFYAQDSGFSP